MELIWKKYRSSEFRLIVINFVLIDHVLDDIHDGIELSHCTHNSIFLVYNLYYSEIYNLLCQKVFRSIALALSSSYSFLDTHILLKVSNAANIDPLHKTLSLILHVNKVRTPSK